MTPPDTQLIASSRPHTVSLSGGDARAAVRVVPESGGPTPMAVIQRGDMGLSDRSSATAAAPLPVAMPADPSPAAPGMSAAMQLRLEALQSHHRELRQALHTLNRPASAGPDR
jgi:hypothetical protein